MDISDIAEIITGVATFTVAVVLVMQLRKQNPMISFWMPADMWSRYLQVFRTGRYFFHIIKEF